MNDNEYVTTHMGIVHPEPPFDFFKTVNFAMYHKQRYVTELFKEGIYTRLLAFKDSFVLTQATSLGTVNTPVIRIDVSAPKLTEEMKAFSLDVMVRVLGADRSIISFYEIAAQDKSLGPIIRLFWGLRIPQAPSVFEALVLSVLGQQISNEIAKVHRTRLVDIFGCSVEIEGEKYIAFPRPQDIAGAGIGALRKLQISTRKAEYLVNISDRLASQDLDLENLRRLSDVDVVEALTDLRGIGPWTAQWMLVRAFGRPDGFPSGDVALQRFMGQFINNGIRMDSKDALAASARWSPHRSYLTTYMFAAGRVNGLLPSIDYESGTPNVLTLDGRFAEGKDNNRC